MARAGIKEGDVIRVSTERNRRILVRVGEPLQDKHAHHGVLKIDRFIRQALKVHLNEEVHVEPANPRFVGAVELLPSIDVSGAHDLLPHIKTEMLNGRTPVSLGTVVHINFPGSQAGTTYQVHKLPDGEGIVGPDTEVKLHYHDSHIPEGAYDVTFEDIGGLGRQIKLLRELVQLPLLFPEVYRRLGIVPPRGVILYGPPGAGKTHLARAIANEVNARLYYINGPDVIGTYAGETEGNLRRIFNEASHHAPSIVFIDEVDAIAPKRDQSGSQSDTRAVTQLLSLMDGLKRVDSVIVLATTNRIDAVDNAFRRAGRFDREIFVGPPDVRGRLEILSIHTREMPLSDAATRALPAVAENSQGFVGADVMELCREAGLSALRRSASNLTDYRAAFTIDTDDIVIDADDFEYALTQVRPSALRETIIRTAETNWNDVVGNESAKDRIKRLLQARRLRGKDADAFGLSAHLGILLYGPPGCGKTMLAHAIAREVGGNFISIDGPELFNKWLGESEESVRNLFRIARQVEPTVLFFDQLDAIAPTRGRHSGSMTNERMVSQLLAELDALDRKSGLVVIGATNRMDLIDPAVLRAGRFGHHIQINLPSAPDRLELLHRFLASQLSGPEWEECLQAIVRDSGELSAAQLRQICEEARRIGFQKNPAGDGSISTADLQLAASLIRDDVQKDNAGG
jgi:transitional endoplasmic reticulum ATPase